jgi:hypothetical protein
MPSTEGGTDDTWKDGVRGVAQLVEPGAAGSNPATTYMTAMTRDAAQSVNICRH